MKAAVVLVSSPGPGPGLHWSHAAAAALATCLVERGAAVAWLPVTTAGVVLPPVPEEVLRQGPFVVAATGDRPWRVAAAHQHLPLEVALTRTLRASGAIPVVHLGLGARGSPNVNWLAERLGAEPFAVVRAAEVVCHRGDLVDRDGLACDDFLDAERCRHCCRASRLRRPRVDELQNRGDLLAASLLVSSAVFVPATDDVRRLEQFGVPPRSLVVAAEPAAIAARLLP